MSYDEDASMNEPSPSPANGGGEDEGEAPESQSPQGRVLPPFGSIFNCPKCGHSVDLLPKKYHPSTAYRVFDRLPCEALADHGTYLDEHICVVCQCGFGWCETTYENRPDAPEE